MKKILACFMVVMVILSTSLLSVSASGSIVTSNFQQDWGAFFDNADLISYDKSGVVFSCIQPVSENISSFSIQSSNSGSSSDIKSYTSTTVKFTPTTKQNMKDIATIMSSGSNSNYRELAEKSGMGTLYSTIYFSEVTSNGKGYVKLDKATCGYTGSTLSGGVRFLGSSATMGQSGITTKGSYKNQTKVCSGSSIYYPNSSWLPVANVDKSIVGLTYTVKFSRGNDTWSTTLTNNVF